MSGVQHIIDHTSGKVRPMRLETVSGVLSVDGSGQTQPISATALPLPSGAATESSLSTISGCVSANEVAVSIASSVATTVAMSKDFASLSSAASVTAGDFSSSHNVSNYNKLFIAGTHTGSDNIEIHISNDDTTYYKLEHISMYPNGTDNAFSSNMDAPFKYYKLKYLANGTATANGFASV